MKLTYEPYTLELKNVFTIAKSSRSTTPVVLTKIEHEGYTGYGEASMPPYLGESHDTVASFLNKVDLSRFDDPFLLDDILEYIDSVDEGNSAAKASVDIALHDLIGKMLNAPLHKIWGYNKLHAPLTSYTIGIDTLDMIRKKAEEASEFKILKIKLGSDNDKEIVDAIRSVSNQPLTVDANQGWEDKFRALDMIYWLQERNTLFIEQPMPKTNIDDMAWLTGKSPLPTIADESVQSSSDVAKLKDVFTGVNIKLMKCKGLRDANKMIAIARALDMKIMLGCMTETSCAISAAAQISPKVDWADLDGNLLISNDPYKGITIDDGRVVLNNHPGIGLY